MGLNGEGLYEGLDWLSTQLKNGKKWTFFIFYFIYKNRFFIYSKILLLKSKCFLKYKSIWIWRCGKSAAKIAEDFGLKL